MSGRIDDIFARQRAAGRTGLMPFVTGGYPTLAATAAVLPALEAELGPEGGIVEIGIPFSDPIADGPVIAASMHEALTAGVTPPAASALGLVAMVSASIVYRMGVARFMANAADAGFDGLIVPDLTDNGQGRDDDLGEIAASHGLSFSLLVAPATSPDRLKRIVSRCRGFVYVLARAGLTGEQQAAPEIADRVAAIRKLTDLPVAAGFGISRPRHVAAVTAVADAAVVGSAIVRRMSDGGDPARAAAEYVKSLVAALARRGP
ncbi:MAG: tryptophan synthase subunit alpha [Planctomycetota bacterium]